MEAGFMLKLHCLMRSVVVEKKEKLKETGFFFGGRRGGVAGGRTVGAGARALGSFFYK